MRKGIPVMAKATITVCDACEKMASRIKVETVKLTLDIAETETKFEFDSHMRDRCIWNNLRKIRPSLTESVEKKFPASVAADDDSDDEADDADTDE